jgi:glycosyltransferase involved in cell wall biosynthesis
LPKGFFRKERTGIPLRITIVSETYFPQINGVSRTLEKLVGHCCARGDQVQLLVPRYDGSMNDDPAGVERRDFPGFALPCYREVLLPLTTPATIRKELSRFGTQLVHIATEGSLGWVALRAARSLGLPVVSSYHTNFPQYLAGYRLGWLEPLAWRYLRWFHNRTLQTFCPTPSIQSLLLKRGFNNVSVWGRGVDSEHFHPSRRDEALRRALGFLPQETVLVYLGRLAAEKNLQMLFDAFEGLPADSSCRLLVIGDGPLGERLRRGADQRVVFAGYRRGTDLARMLAVGDLLVFPSLTDTFGNVMLEGMASGLPVLGFEVPGPKDVIIDGHTGRIVQRPAAAGLAQAIHKMAGDRDALRKMGRQARGHAESQSWSLIMESIREQYDGHIPDPARCGRRPRYAD